MIKRLLAAGVLAGLWAPAAAQVSTLDALRAMANAPAGAVATPASTPPPATKDAAADAAISIMWRTMTANLSQNRRRFMNEHVVVIVVPQETTMVDQISATIALYMPPAEAAAEIANLKRSYAARMDHTVERTSQEPRGYTGDYRMGSGRTICFVGAENLDSSVDFDQNGSRRWRLGVHELAHAVLRMLTPEEAAQLKQIAIDYYSDRTDEKGRYHEGDENDFFAEGSEVWFGVHQTDLNQKGWDVGTAPKKFVRMKLFLEYIYGPARDVWPY